MTATFRSALASADFRRLLVSHALATTAALMLAMAVGVEVLARTGSGLWVSITVSLSFLPYVLVSGLAGVVADRHSRSRVLAWSAVLRAVCAGAIALGVASSWPVAMLVVLAAVAAVLGTASYPALAAATPDLVPDAQLPPANALVTAVENAAWIGGPGAMGLVLLAGGGPGAAALVATTLFTQAAVAAWRVRLPGPPRSSSGMTDSGNSGATPAGRAGGSGDPGDSGGSGDLVPAGVVDTLLAGVRLVISDRRARVPITMAVLDNFLYGYLVVAMLLLGDDVWATATGAVGWLTAAFAAGAFAALAVTNRIAAHPRPQRVLPALMVLFALSASAVSLTDRLPVAVVLVLVAGASTLVAEVLAVTLLQRAAPPEVTARVFGVYDQLNVGAIALGSAAAGPLARLWGTSNAVGVVGLAVLGASVAVGIQMRSLCWDASAPTRVDPSAVIHSGNLLPRQQKSAVNHRESRFFVARGRRRAPGRPRSSNTPAS